MKTLWLLPIIGAVLASLVFLLTLAGSSSSPQEAAGYAMAVALAVIPYVLTRCVYAMTETKLDTDVTRIASAVEKLVDRTQ